MKNEIQITKPTYLYDYVFWYNPYEELWYSIKSDTQLNFFNGNRKKSVFYKARDINSLIEFLERENNKNI
jgi:hypothetical protein